MSQLRIDRAAGHQNVSSVKKNCHCFCGTRKCTSRYHFLSLNAEDRFQIRLTAFSERVRFPLVLGLAFFIHEFGVIHTNKDMPHILCSKFP